MARASHASLAGHENLRHRYGLRRARRGRGLRRLRQRRHLRRRRRGQDRAPQARARSRSTSRASTSWSRTTPREGRLAFTTDVGAARRAAPRSCFIAVGTPPRRGRLGRSLVRVRGRRADRRARSTGCKVIVTKSTVPVGHRRQDRGDHRPASRRTPFGVASNPEFLKEGDAVNDFMKPDRVVIGADDRSAREVLRAALRALRRARATASTSWTRARPSSRSTRRTRCSRRASRS